jgi:hypothetical protein
MRDDYVPPATKLEDRHDALLLRHSRLRLAMSKWNEIARSMGYDGVEPALLSLQAMQKGPRPATEKPAPAGYWRCQCGEAHSNENKRCPGEVREAIPPQSPWKCDCGQLNTYWATTCGRCEREPQSEKE